MENWKPKVGDEVYIVPNDTRDAPRYVTITKVGRLYAEYGDYWCKINLSDMAITMRNYGYQGYVYKSKQDYMRHLELIEKGRYIKDNLHKLTDEQIETVYNMLVPTDSEPKQ